MASRSLGSLTIDLIAKIGGWTQGLTKAERDLDRSTKRMNKMANDFGRSIGASLRSAAAGFLAFAGVSVSIGAAASAIKGAIDRADQLRDASIRLGIGVETLSAYGYAAQQTGTDIEELNKGLLRLARNSATALDPKSRQSNLFEALGVSKDALSDFDKLVPQVANAFSQMEDGATKAALAQELFGRSGANLIEFLNQGESGLKTLTDRARELGVVINDETAAAADDFNDKLGDLKAAGTGLATQVASELLPQLTSLVDWAIEFVSDGDNAREIADGLSDGFKDLSDAVGSVASIGSGLLDFLGRVREGMSGLEKQAKGATQALMSVFTLNEQQRNAGFALYQQGTDQINGKPRFAGVQGTPTRLPTVSVVGNLDSIAKQEAARIKEQKALQDRINKYLGNPTGRTDKPKKTGKSDAEKEADQLKAAYDRMNESLAEQIALFGETTEAAKVRYEFESGQFSKLTEAQLTKLGIDKQALIGQAEKIDLMEEEADVQKELDRLTKDREDAINRGIEATDDLIADMEFELQLLGLTNKEREKAIALRHADAAATDEQKQAVADLSDTLYEANETAAIVDDLKASLSDAFVDFASGAKSAKEAFGDFADYMYKKALQLLADKAIEALFKSFSGAASGGYGESAGGFADFFGSANSGFGFANGGFTGYGGRNQVAGIVHKGEYVMPMDAVSRIGVSGMDRIAKGGGIGGVSQNFYTMGIETRRTQERKAQLAGREARRAMARTGR